MVTMKRAIRLFESALTIGILAVLFVVLAAAFVDIAYVIYLEILAPPVLIIDASGLMGLFGLLLVYVVKIFQTRTALG